MATVRQKFNKPKPVRKGRLPKKFQDVPNAYHLFKAMTPYRLVELGRLQKAVPITVLEIDARCNQFENPIVAFEKYSNSHSGRKLNFNDFIDSYVFIAASSLPYIYVEKLLSVSPKELKKINARCKRIPLVATAYSIYKQKYPQTKLTVEKFQEAYAELATTNMGTQRLERGKVAAVGTLRQINSLLNVRTPEEIREINFAERSMARGIKKEFGGALYNEIRRLLRETNMTQAEIADAKEVSPETVKKIRVENPKDRSAIRAKRIANKAVGEARKRTSKATPKQIQAELLKTIEIDGRSEFRYSASEIARSLGVGKNAVARELDAVKKIRIPEANERTRIRKQKENTSRGRGGTTLDRAERLILTTLRSSSQILDDLMKFDRENNIRKKTKKGGRAFRTRNDHISILVRARVRVGLKGTPLNSTKRLSLFKRTKTVGIIRRYGADPHKDGILSSVLRLSDLQDKIKKKRSDLYAARNKNKRQREQQLAHELNGLVLSFDDLLTRTTSQHRELERTFEKNRFWQDLELIAA